MWSIACSKTSRNSAERWKVQTRWTSRGNGAPRGGEAPARYELLRVLPPRPDELERPRDEAPLRLDDEPLRVEELRLEDRPLSFAVLRSLAIDSRWLPLLRRVELPISRRAEELLRP